MHKPRIIANDLLRIILEDLPELAGSLPNGAPIDPHRVMRVLFDHANQIIQCRDTNNVIRCFRLLRKLTSLDSECDTYVRSAIWASCINRFDRKDPIALEIFRAIDPQTRIELLSPVTFPHTWLREIEIKFPDASGWRTGFTVSHSVDAEVRFVTQMSSNDHFAIVHLQMESDLDLPQVLLTNRLEEWDAPLAYVEAVIEGVTSGLMALSDRTRGPRYLRINLLGLRHHLVDSRYSDFVKVAKTAVQQCLNKTELVDI